MDTKPWYKSKIFWVSLGAIVTNLGGWFVGELELSVAATAVLTALIAIFRLFFTSTNLTT